MRFYHEKYETVIVLYVMERLLSRLSKLCCMRLNLIIFLRANPWSTNETPKGSTAAKRLM